MEFFQNGDYSADAYKNLATGLVISGLEIAGAKFIDPAFEFTAAAKIAYNKLTNSVLTSNTSLTPAY